MLFSLSATGSAYAHDEETNGSSETTSLTTPFFDSSFGITNPQYTAKLFYVSDYAQPMVQKMKSGLFGKTSVATIPQDGSTLTPLNGSGEHGWAGMISEIAQIAGQITGDANTTKELTTKGHWTEDAPQHKKIAFSFKIISW